MRYEILEGLPPYGPMYVSIPDTDVYSEGFVVGFCREDGTSWVANFKRGVGEAEGVYELGREGLLLIVAAGSCYIMNPAQTTPISSFGWGYNKLFAIEGGRFVLVDNTSITVVAATGDYWHSEDIAMDGIKDAHINNGVVSGCAYTCTSWGGKWRWVEFSYDINEKKETYGRMILEKEDMLPEEEDKPPKNERKPWWRLL